MEGPPEWTLTKIIIKHNYYDINIIVYVYLYHALVSKPSKNERPSEKGKFGVLSFLFQANDDLCESTVVKLICQLKSKLYYKMF